MTSRSGRSSLFNVGALMVALTLFASRSFVIAQPISFYPGGDSLSLWGTCTPSGVIWRTVADSSEEVRVVMHRYAGEFIHGNPPNHIIARFDSAYFTVHDSLHLNRYELWCTSLSSFYPGRYRIPPDTASIITPGPFIISLYVYRDSLLLDSARVSGISYQTGLNVDDTVVPVPAQIQLYANYPNPFNGETTIVYELPSSGKAKVYVVDLLGRIIQVLVDGYQPAGLHTLHWEPSHVSSGSHFIVLTAGTQRTTIRCQLLR